MIIPSSFGRKSLENEAFSVKRLSNWRRLLYFFLVLLLGELLAFAVIVLPFYPEFLDWSAAIQNTFDNDHFFLLLTQFASLCAALFSLWYMKKKVGDYTFASIRPFNVRPFTKGCLISLAILAVCTLIMQASHLIVFHYVSLSNFPLSILFFLIVAVTEEIVFRGYVLNNLLEKIAPTRAVITSSLLFALIHLPNADIEWIGFVNIFLFGVLTSVFFLNSNNLSVPIGIHFAWNLVQDFFGFSVSGQKSMGSFSIEYQVSGHYLTGGAFGMEGSILLVPITLVAIFLSTKLLTFPDFRGKTST